MLFEIYTLIYLFLNVLETMLGKIRLYVYVIQSIIIRCSSACGRFIGFCLGMLFIKHCINLI